MWHWLVLALLVALGLLLLLWLGLHLRGRLRLPERAPLEPLASRYPIVLVHGYCGFERFGWGGGFDPVELFAELIEELRERGL